MEGTGSSRAATIFAGRRRTWGLGNPAATQDFLSRAGTGKRRRCSGVSDWGKPQSGPSISGRSAGTGRKARAAPTRIAAEDRMVRGCVRGPYRAAEVDERRAARTSASEGALGPRKVRGRSPSRGRCYPSRNTIRELDRDGNAAGSVTRPRRTTRRWKAVRAGRSRGPVMGASGELV
jgi:hypothetical protein